MNPYERYVLPKMIDIACSTGNVMKARSEEHTSELQSPVPTSYSVFGLKKKTKQ